MNRHGFVLPAVLVGLALLVLVAFELTAAVREHVRVTTNRAGMMAARQAADACFERLRMDARPERWELAIDSLPIGTNAWCSAGVRDPGARIDVNTADSALLVRMLGDELTAATVRRRLRVNGPVTDLAELSDIDGLAPGRLDALATVATTRGDGLVNVNEAAEEVLALLPGLSSSAARILVSARGRGELRSIENLLERLPPSYAKRAAGSYQELSRVVRFAPAAVDLDVVGYAAGFRTGIAVLGVGRFVDGRLVIDRRVFP